MGYSKEGIGAEANAHIDALPKKRKLLSESFARRKIQVLEEEGFWRAYAGSQSPSSILYPFVKGKSIGEILGELISQGKAPVKEIQEALHLLLGEESFIKPANLDLLFENVIMDGEQAVLIDCEWVKEEGEERLFLLSLSMNLFLENGLFSLAGKKLRLIDGKQAEEAFFVLVF